MRVHVQVFTLFFVEDWTVRGFHYYNNQSILSSLEACLSQDVLKRADVGRLLVGGCGAAGHLKRGGHPASVGPPGA
jgi:hypothetical protein